MSFLVFLPFFHFLSMLAMALFTLALFRLFAVLVDLRFQAVPGFEGARFLIHVYVSSFLVVLPIMVSSLLSLYSGSFRALIAAGLSLLGRS